MKWELYNIMAYFSKLGLNGKVLEVVSVNNDVITDENGIEQEQKGIDFLTEQTNWPVWVNNVLHQKKDNTV